MNVHPNICKLVSTEIPVWHAFVPGINTIPDIQFPDRFEEISDLGFLRSQITCSYVICGVRLFAIHKNDKSTWICHTEKSLVYINFKKYGPGISVVKTRNMSDRSPRKLIVNVRHSRVPRGSVVRCLTCNPGVLGSSLTRSSGFFSWECPWARHFRA